MPPAFELAFILAVLLSACITIAAHYVQPARPWLIYIFKPLTTILILSVALLPGTWRMDAYARAIALGLFFSLAGDILLMLPRDLFVPGLASFLVGHLCYISAFRAGLAAPDFMLVLALFIMFATGMLRYLRPGVIAPLRLPVGLYVVVITVMVTLAVGRWISKPSLESGSVALGALLFMASDTLLAVDRFRRPFHLARAAVLSTYFAGQLLIALST